MRFWEARNLSQEFLPLGYAYSSTYARIRAAEKDDLALIVSGLPANAAGVFTQNRVQAAPVKLSRTHLRLSKGLVGAILVNAGNANCATRTGDAVTLLGTEGSLSIDAQQIAKWAGTISYSVLCGIHARVKRIYS